MNPESTSTEPKKESLSHPTFAEAFRFWLKLGFISFGGPAGQIAIMHAELVEKKRWISETRFLHALNYCMLLPGPEAQQLATYIGWLLHRTWGGIVAGALFVIPSMFILGALSFVYVTYGNTPWISALFYGLKPAVLAIIASAVIRIGKKALKNEVMWLLAGVAFISIFFFKIPFPLIIGGAALVGLTGGKFAREKFLVFSGHGSSKNEASVLDDHDATPDHAKPSLQRALKIITVCLLLWWTPIFLVGSWLGNKHVLFQEGLFFSKAAMVTFGGAYAVLPYVSQQAVDHYQWVTLGQMLDGLGLAETTPGPLIMVLQFVGFLGGYHHPGPLSPLLAATLGALLTTWVTFVPCFLWIFLGAPHIEQLRGNEKITMALSAVTAAVVGVILNLATWFGIHLILPSPGRLDYFALAVSMIAFLGMTRWKWGMIPVILGSGITGILYQSFRSL